MKHSHTPRLPTKEEFQQLALLEEYRLTPGGMDVGDLGYLLDHCYIAVFDNFDQDGKPDYPQGYKGKYMLVVWGLRIVSEYVWIKNQIVLVDETNKKNIW